MRKQLVLATLLLISMPAWSADCFDMAGRDYRIDPDLLRAISWQESKWKVNAIGKNPGAGYGAGLMQIDSQHQGELSQYGIKPGHLLTDACLNIYTGAYYLALAFKNGESAGRQSAPTTPGSGERTGRPCDDWSTPGRLRPSTSLSRKIKMPASHL